MSDITRTPEEWEAIALRFRADCGIVPYNIWVQLSEESTKRLGELNQEAAKRYLASMTPPTVNPLSRTAPLSETSADRIAIDDLCGVAHANTVDLEIDMQDVRYEHRSPNRTPWPGSRITLESFKASMLATIELTQGVVGSVPDGYADAIKALPDRTLLGKMPKDVQTFIERELADIEVPK